MKLFGYSISLNVLILIGILYLIMVVNAISSSCNREGLSSVEKNFGNALKIIVNPAVDKSPNPTTAVNKIAIFYSFADQLVKALDDGQTRVDANTTLKKIVALKVT